MLALWDHMWIVLRPGMPESRLTATRIPLETAQRLARRAAKRGELVSRIDDEIVRAEIAAALGVDIGPTGHDCTDVPGDEALVAVWDPERGTHEWWHIIRR